MEYKRNFKSIEHASRQILEQRTERIIDGNVHQCRTWAEFPNERILEKCTRTCKSCMTYRPTVSFLKINDVFLYPVALDRSFDFVLSIEISR